MEEKREIIAELNQEVHNMQLQSTAKQEIITELNKEVLNFQEQLLEKSRELERVHETQVKALQEVARLNVVNTELREALSAAQNNGDGDEDLALQCHKQSLEGATEEQSLRSMVDDMTRQLREKRQELGTIKAQNERLKEMAEDSNRDMLRLQELAIQQEQDEEQPRPHRGPDHHTYCWHVSIGQSCAMHVCTRVLGAKGLIALVQDFNIKMRHEAKVHSETVQQLQEQLQLAQTSSTRLVEQKLELQQRLVQAEGDRFKQLAGGSQHEQLQEEFQRMVQQLKHVQKKYSEKCELHDKLQDKWSEANRSMLQLQQENMSLRLSVQEYEDTAQISPQVVQLLERERDELKASAMELTALRGQLEPLHEEAAANRQEIADLRLQCQVLEEQVKNLGYDPVMVERRRPGRLREKPGKFQQKMILKLSRYDPNKTAVQQ